MNAEADYASRPRYVGASVDVADRKQLFLDDGFLVESTVETRCVLNQPTKHPRNPLIGPDKPWENDLQFYGSVHWDEGIKDSCLELNADATWAEMRVEILNEDQAVIAGFDQDQCVPATADSLRHRIEWRWGDPGALVDTSVRLRFHLRFARLLAFQFRG